MQGSETPSVYTVGGNAVQDLPVHVWREPWGSRLHVTSDVHPSESTESGVVSPKVEMTMDLCLALNCMRMFKNSPSSGTIFIHKLLLVQ